MQIVAFIFRYLLQLRYKVEIINKALLTHPQSKLILANHVALVDPQIAVSEIMRYTQISPVIDYNYLRIPIVGWVIHLLKPIAVHEPSKKKYSKILSISEKIVAHLATGKNVLIYPSGQLTADGNENIGNKRAAYEVISRIPNNSKVYLLKISGLWRSSSSKYKTGQTPNLFGWFVQSFIFLLRHDIFFAPRRTVRLTFIDITDTIGSFTDKKSMNQYLEDCFNKSTND